MTVAPTTVRTAFVAKLVAKDDTAEEVVQFLASALELAEQEPGTIVWYVLRTDAVTFWIVDAFPDEDARQDHITGPIAAALAANAERLFAAPPEILPADVLAAKMP